MGSFREITKVQKYEQTGGQTGHGQEDPLIPISLCYTGDKNGKKYLPAIPKFCEAAQANLLGKYGEYSTAYPCLP